MAEYDKSNDFYKYLYLRALNYVNKCINYI